MSAAYRKLLEQPTEQELQQQEQQDQGQEQELAGAAAPTPSFLARQRDTLLARIAAFMAAHTKVPGSFESIGSIGSVGFKRRLKSGSTSSRGRALLERTAAFLEAERGSEPGGAAAGRVDEADQLLVSEVVDNQATLVVEIREFLKQTGGQGQGQGPSQGMSQGKVKGPSPIQGLGQGKGKGKGKASGNLVSSSSFSKSTLTGVQGEAAATSPARMLGFLPTSSGRGGGAGGPSGGGGGVGRQRPRTEAATAAAAAAAAAASSEASELLTDALKFLQLRRQQARLQLRKQTRSMQVPRAAPGVPEAEGTEAVLEEIQAQLREKYEGVAAGRAKQQEHRRAQQVGARLLDAACWADRWGGEGA